MENTGGRYSEWNEGALKSARLHEIQYDINQLKLEPLGITNGKFNYLHLIRQLNNLLEEGYSKYSPTERTNVDQIRVLINRAIRLLPATQTLISEEIGGETKTFVVNQENFNNMLELLLLFERHIKDYNDAHGLTTMNREDEGDWD